MIAYDLAEARHTLRTTARTEGRCDRIRAEHQEGPTYVTLLRGCPLVAGHDGGCAFLPTRPDLLCEVPKYLRQPQREWKPMRGEHLFTSVDLPPALDPRLRRTATRERDEFGARIHVRIADPESRLVITAIVHAEGEAGLPYTVAEMEHRLILRYDLGYHAITNSYRTGSATIRLSGGPADGREMAVPANAGWPAERWVVPVLASPALWAADESPDLRDVAVREAAYRRPTWPESDGVWVYQAM